MLGPWICLRAALVDLCTDAADDSRVAMVTFVPQFGFRLDWTKALVIGFFNIRTFGPTAMPQQQ
jgi:hypothetical protein